ncbi:hypothetical protein L0337_34025 [candidate division KSB1 bacterium]|nr:hypothetical protein [candidate division KSB1 bacterium]
MPTTKNALSSKKIDTAATPKTNNAKGSGTGRRRRRHNLRKRLRDSSRVSLLRVCGEGDPPASTMVWVEVCVEVLSAFFRLGINFNTELRDERGHYEFDRDETLEPDVLGLVDDAHAAFAGLGEDFVVRNGLADHSFFSLGIFVKNLLLLLTMFFRNIIH